MKDKTNRAWYFLSLITLSTLSESTYEVVALGGILLSLFFYARALLLHMKKKEKPLFDPRLSCFSK